MREILDKLKTGKRTLHITSEQKTATTIQNSAIDGEVLVWQDALYEGPLLNDESITELSAIRADYFARLGWGEYTDILALYDKRNKVLESYPQYHEVVLWFDSGLNNQLQLVQLVNWFSRQNTGRLVLSIVSADRMTDVVGFVDFALLNKSQLEKLYRTKSELTNAQVAICHRAWDALTSPTPSSLLKIFPRDMSSMPYLKNAILRFVQQFPAKNNGLCKTEQLIVQALKNSQTSMENIYINVQGKEPIPFMSQAIFNAYLQNMIISQHPMIEKHVIEKTEALEVSALDAEEPVAEEVVIEQEYELRLTKLSGQITNNWVDWVQLNGINKCIGGVHLHDGNIWRYNMESRQLMKTYV